MYIILYSFKVKPNQEENFIEGWTGLTNLIYKYEGSLGSRLHKKAPLEYIAYAQWPNKIKFESAGDHLPIEADTYRNLMRTSCSSIDTIDKFEVVKDLLAENTYD